MHANTFLNGSRQNKFTEFMSSCQDFFVSSFQETVISDQQSAVSDQNFIFDPYCQRRLEPCYEARERRKANISEYVVKTLDFRVQLI